MNNSGRNKCMFLEITKLNWCRHLWWRKSQQLPPGLRWGVPRKKVSTKWTFTKMKGSLPPCDGLLSSKMATHCQCGWQPSSVSTGPPVCMNSTQNQGFFSVESACSHQTSQSRMDRVPHHQQPLCLPQAPNPKEGKASSTFPGAFNLLSQDL